MGLGKTIQIVALLWAAYRKTGYDSIDSARQQRRRDIARLQLKYGKDRVETQERGMTLVITKHSIIQQWMGELTKWGCFDVVAWPSGEVSELDRLVQYRNSKINLKLALPGDRTYFQLVSVLLSHRYRFIFAI
jgi:SNF2 family DNA or RNA helicase